MKIVIIVGALLAHVRCEINFQNCVLRHTRTNQDLSTDHVISCGLSQNNLNKKTANNQKGYNKVFTRLNSNEQNKRNKRNLDSKEFCYKTESYENLKKKLESCRPEQIIERRINLKSKSCNLFKNKFKILSFLQLFRVL